MTHTEENFNDEFKPTTQKQMNHLRREHDSKFSFLAYLTLPNPTLSWRLSSLSFACHRLPRVTPAITASDGYPECHCYHRK